MDLGRIIQVGTPQELYNRPIDACGSAPFGPTNLLQGRLRARYPTCAVRSWCELPVGRLIGWDDSGPNSSRNTADAFPVRPRPCATRGPTIPAGWNRFPATVERITFRGELRQIHARGPGDWPIAVSAIQSQSQTVREGQSVTLSVAPEHVVVLPGKFAVAKPA